MSLLLLYFSLWMSAVVSTAPCDASCRTHLTVDRLQSQWYSSISGTWGCGLGGVSWWHCGNALETLCNAIQYTNNKSHVEAVHHTWVMTAVGYPLHRGTSGLDDIGWWGLAWARATEVTGDKTYLERSEGYFKEMTLYWDDTCGGGVWWNRKRSYKNAITNELFLALAGTLYNQTGDVMYLQWARKEWSWFLKAGLINTEGLINDGLTSNCTNNGQTTWTYNQGVILSGLSALATTTQGSDRLALLSTVVRIANSTLHHLTKDGVLREPCEDEGCDADGQQFKGIFVRHLGYYMHQWQQHESSVFQEFIQYNSDAIWTHDRNTHNNECGVHWNGPLITPNVITHTSAIDVFNAALLLASL